MDYVGILRETPLFKSLDDEELAAVAKCIRAESFDANAVVIKEETPGESLFVVSSGKLRVEKQDGDTSLVLAELGPGTAFGEMSLISSFPTSATVVAVEKSELMSIGRLDLNVLLSWNPILAAKMWRSFTEMLSNRLRDMNERMLRRFGQDAFKEED
jgi:CRP/FNR family cyclic AMP-dependent transcriptional regulator